MNAIDLKRASLILFAFWMSILSLSAGNWEMIESNSGISMYERWVRINDNLTVRERKGEMVIKGDMNTVIKVLSDPSKTKLWMENVSDAHLVKKVSDNEWSSYTYFSLPWPLKNRDMVSVASLKYPNPGTAVIEMVSRENSVPVNKSVTRLSNFKATWKISDMGNGNVFVSLVAISVANPEYPRFILDPVVRGVFMRNLIKLKVLITI